MSTTKQDGLDIDLDQFSGGTTDRYRHSLNRRVIWSGGVDYLAAKTQAFWLVDAIASYLVPHFMKPAGRKDGRVLSLHFWRLDVADDQSAVLYAEADFGVPPFLSQQIEYTDFPLKEARIWAAFDGEFWVLYLPQEH